MSSFSCLPKRPLDSPTEQTSSRPRLNLSSSDAPPPPTRTRATHSLPLPPRAQLSPSSPSQLPPSPPFQQPTPLTTFSMTATPSSTTSTSSRRTQIHDNSGLATFKSPPIGADLGARFETAVWRREGTQEGENPGIDGLVESLRVLEEGSGGQKVMGKGREGVITWRGILTKFLVAPYEERDGWELNAMIVDGNLYLEQHKPPDDPSRRTYPNEKLFSYYGYAFESYCTTPSTPHPPPPPSSSRSWPKGWSGDVDTNNEWCAVVKTSLAGVRLVLGGEVDCLRGEYDGTLNSAVELKTNTLLRSERDEVNFEKKLLKHWAQSFLLGIPEILIGFRTSVPSQPALLHSLQSFATMSLPRLVRSKPHAWHPSVCLSWAGEALTFLRRVIVEESENENGSGEIRTRKPRVWRVKFDPHPSKRVLEVWELEEEEEVRVVSKGRDVEGEEGKGRWGFLPGWMGEKS